jgi:hypothetical protein
VRPDAKPDLNARQRCMLTLCSAVHNYLHPTSAEQRKGFYKLSMNGKQCGLGQIELEAGRAKVPGSRTPKKHRQLNNLDSIPLEAVVNQ